MYLFTSYEHQTEDLHSDDAFSCFTMIALSYDLVFLVSRLQRSRTETQTKERESPDEMKRKHLGARGRNT